MWRVLDGSIGAEFLQDFTAQGRVGLSWYDAGARSFYARQPVRSLNDLQGKTIRVQDSQKRSACWVQCRRPRRTGVYWRLRPGRSMPPKNNWPAYYSMAAGRYYKKCTGGNMGCAGGIPADPASAPAAIAPALGAGGNSCPKSGMLAEEEMQNFRHLPDYLKRYRQSDNRERDESNKKAHSFEVMLHGKTLPVQCYKR